MERAFRNTTRFRKTGLVSPASYNQVFKRQPSKVIPTIPGYGSQPNTSRPSQSVAANVSGAAVRKTIIEGLMGLQKR